jgi:hypothetical protein
VSAEISSKNNLNNQNGVMNEYDTRRYTKKNFVTSLGKMDSSEKPLETVLDDNYL